MMKSQKYCTDYIIITPARNEGEFLELTVKSVVAQTIRPLQWIIVSDGSTDRTDEIAQSAARCHSWIRFVKRKDRGFRQQGGGVVETFYDGYNLIKNTNWDYLVKLDGDLSFDCDYFEKIFNAFTANKTLGITGGLIHNINGTSIWPENTSDPNFHVRGATKVYKKHCWLEIEPLIIAPGWDTLDEVKANMKGWETYTLYDISIIHHRYTGDADGTWNTWVKNGLANYISGYHPLFMFFKCVKRLWQHPYLVGSAGLMWGFLGGYCRDVKRIEDPALIRYIRAQQLKRLLLRKSIWN